ncbi:MAG: Putative lipoprotein thiredoxin [uncultured Sulfurovum sp.]|uniref:Lipoprotein thiredoxin n=1 Tax=uncultured Sulfurovum sp. TaxID=269237 RepID=A0A6S6TRS5_9BACT|nr:MAG: Putative lipoprotein thiredoxin [uncultured Sulfurovum sp.]
MKNKFYLILVPLIFILSACEDKQQNNEKFTSDTQLTKIVIEETSFSSKATAKEYHYEFKNLKGQLSILDIKNDIYNFKNIKQSIVIVNIMSTWCPPCRGQIPHLSKLQQTFKENLFIMSTLVHDDIEKEKLEKFIIAQKVLYYVSVSQSENLKFVDMLTPKLGLNKDFPMPLTVVFVRGKYFTHYEGMIPEEMIESDIKQLLEKIKK